MSTTEAPKLHHVCKYTHSKELRIIASQHWLLMRKPGSNRVRSDNITRDMTHITENRSFAWGRSQTPGCTNTIRSVGRRQKHSKVGIKSN